MFCHTCWWRLTAQGTGAKIGRRPGVRLKYPPFMRGDKIYTLKPQTINTAISMRGNGGIRTRNENFCHELINYAVRIVIVMINL